MALVSWIRSLDGGAFDPGHHHVTAIILAGGEGSRMESDTPKQLLPLNGKPVIAHTLSAFEASKSIREIVLVSRKEEIDTYTAMKEAYGLTKLRRIVLGGERRQDSAMEGFKAISDETEVVLIHDGARCLVTDDIITRVARTALAKGSAIAAERVSSTVKRVGGGGLIEETLDRNSIWLAQTPQGFKTETYRAALYLHLKKNGGEVTDDAMLAEEIDLPVFAVECSSDNLKITTPRDLRLASVILDERQAAAQREETLAARDALDRSKDRAARKEARQP